jgi:hypothetical protein
MCHEVMFGGTVTRRAALFVLLAALGLLALVPVGRWERSRRADEQVRGMAQVLAAVGPLESDRLKAFRYLANFQCLLYQRGANPFALELCVDRRGRLVEAIDRRGGEPAIWSLRDDPTRTTIYLDRREVDTLLHRMGVPPGYLPTDDGVAS